MKPSTHSLNHPAADVPEDAPPEANAGPIRLLAIVAAGTAVYALSPILVPFLLALVVAIAMAPVAAWFERHKFNRTIASILCLLIVLLALSIVAGLVINQAGAILRKSDQYAERLGDAMAKVLRAVGGNQWVDSIAPSNGDGPARSGDAGDALVARVRESIRGDAREIGQWVASGLGGAVGIAGDLVIFLAFYFYMLQGRSEWLERIRKAATGLGMRPRHREFSKVASELKTYLATLAIVSAVYFVVISAALWWIGVPQPLLWGMLTAVLELVPFFGPVIAGAMPAVAALGTGGTWQPLAVIALFVVLQMVEGYVVAPLLYGNAVEIEPVTVILGVLFFGWLLGPAGLALAMPLMLLLRGALVITPDTPALDALADAQKTM